jgi:hypothetical protein
MTPLGAIWQARCSMMPNLKQGCTLSPSIVDDDADKKKTQGTQLRLECSLASGLNTYSGT